MNFFYCGIVPFVCLFVLFCFLLFKVVVVVVVVLVVVVVVVVVVLRITTGQFGFRSIPRP